MPAVALDRLRRTAGRFLRVTGPPARSVRDAVTREVGRRLGGPPAPRVDDTPAGRTPEPTTPPSSPRRSGPSPATIARNVAHERPRATPAAARRDPDAVPGAKLPPRRPRPA